MCTTCGNDKSCQMKCHHLHEYVKHSCHVLLTVGTFFKHICFHTWFVATYLIGTDKDEISVERFSQMVSMGWPNAVRMLITSRQSMGNPDYEYWLDKFVELDEWFPNVNLVICKFRRILAGTILGVSHRFFQEYIGEFAFCFKRRCSEPLLPDRLLQTVVNHMSIRVSHTYS